MVTAMSYHFYAEIEKDSKLIIGNAGGRVKLIFITVKDRGPFQSMAKTPLTWVTYDQFLKGAVKGMKVIDVPSHHSEWVHQVAYYETLHCVVSISTCSTQSMFVWSPNTKDRYSFKVSKGFKCFDYVNSHHIIVTGGPDCLIRVWNPFMNNRALIVFRGHHANIVSVILQQGYKILISLDQDKCVKVWDVIEQTCIQSYFVLSSALGEKLALCTYYNPVSRQVFVASQKICYFQVYPLLNGEYTDGVSHCKEVSVILYNSLFNFLITCGFDSFIIVWNLFTGRRLMIVREAHTHTVHGETIPIQITAAALDPSEQFLITGASDGTLKIWLCSLMTCTRNMSIESKSEIFAIIWIKYRILVMGENRIVTEFFDGKEIGSSACKTWMKKHDEDILCACTFLPQVLVTGSYSGELIFWRLETGQSFAKYNVQSPKVRIQMQYNEKETKKLSIIGDSIPKKTVRKKYSAMFSVLSKTELKLGHLKKDDLRTTLSKVRISINYIICLPTRSVHPQVGTVLAALDNGMIQVWSHHSGGGYLTQFKAIHKPKDYVVSMCTDKINEFVFTGHMSGYIKTWHMINYCILEKDKVHICMPELRLKFPFLWDDLFLGRAKRAHRNYNKNDPLLVNSYRAHLKPVTGLTFINDVEILLSCSSDGSVRIWTINGKYMGTLGTFKPWLDISPTIKPADNIEYPFPADIQRCASFTTRKVMSGGAAGKFLTRQQQQQQLQEVKVDSKLVYGKRVPFDSILGKNYKIEKRSVHHYNITLDTTLHEVPIYGSLALIEPEEIKRPETPPLVHRVQRQNMLLKASTGPRVVIDLPEKCKD